MINRPESDRFEELRPSFIRWFRFFFLALLTLATCIAFTYGTNPILIVGSNGRLIIAILAGFNLIGFLLVGGLLAGEWLLANYSDTRKPPRGSA